MPAAPCCVCCTPPLPYANVMAASAVDRVTAWRRTAQTGMANGLREQLEGYPTAWDEDEEEAGFEYEDQGEEQERDVAGARPSGPAAGAPVLATPPRTTAGGTHGTASPSPTPTPVRVMRGLGIEEEDAAMTGEEEFDDGDEGADEDEMEGWM